jgi:hypothetical protein
MQGFIIAHTPWISSLMQKEAIADFSFLTSSSVLFDAVYIPHGLV